MTVFQGPTNINLLFKSNSLTSTANLLEVIPDRATITLSAGCYFHVRSLLAVDELLVAESTSGGWLWRLDSNLRRAPVFHASFHALSEKQI
jgi:hypothetical protein